MKTIRDYKQTLNEQWCIHLDSFDPDDEANQETIYTLANGYMGIRGCLELQGLKKQPGTYIAGLFDKKETSDCCSAKPSLAAKNKAITPAYAIVPDANLIAITVDGVPFDFINCKVVDFSRVLDMYNGYVINEYTLENYKGQIISLKTLSIVSKKYLHSALFKFEIVPLNFAGNIIVSFKNTLCLTPQYIARLKDYICRTELISADEIAGSCVVKAKVVETDAEIVLKAKTVGSGKRFIAKKQDGIDEIFNIAAEQGKNYSFNKFIMYKFIFLF